MKHWGSALFPLSILAALTILTFWLRYATEMTEPRRDGKTRHDPDYIVSDVVLRKLDANGQLKYTLRAADVRHYPDDDSTDLKAMIRANLVAERVAVETYRQIIQLVADKDPTTKRMLEGILEQEEEHAEELSDWLED